jgi:hypothetical protein
MDQTKTPKLKKTIRYRPKSYVIKSSDNVEFKFDQGITKRWDYFEDRLEFIEDLSEKNSKRFEPFDVRWNSKVVAKFQMLDNMIADINKGFDGSDPLIYNEIEPIARFMSPTDCYWEIFCLRDDLDVVPTGMTLTEKQKLIHDYKVRLGKAARLHKMPLWFATDMFLVKNDPVLSHNNFNLCFDPIYRLGDVEIKHPTERCTLSEITWLNLTTYIVYTAWVKNSYSRLKESPGQYIDWTFCGEWEKIGDNYKMLSENCKLEDLMENRTVSDLKLYALGGPSTYYCQTGRKLISAHEIYQICKADRDFIYARGVAGRKFDKEYTRLSFWQSHEWIARIIGIDHDLVYRYILEQNGLEWFVPPKYRPRRSWPCLTDIYAAVYAYTNRIIIQKYVRENCGLKRTDLRPLANDFREQLGSDALIAIQAILKTYLNRSLHSKALGKINTFCQL